MTIEKIIEDGKTILKIAGRLDTSTAPEFEQAVDQVIPETEDLVLDFDGLEYISSAGLRVILKAQKQMNAKGAMRLINVNDSIMEVFDITGFIDILTIE